MAAYPGESQKAKEGLGLLREQYAKLMMVQNERQSKNASVKLATMQKRLENMFELLSIWQQYVHIIYAPESEINAMQVQKDKHMFSS